MGKHNAALLACASLALLLVGCGGGSMPTDAPSGTGRAILHIVWPDRSRLIPVASNAIKVTFQRGGELLASQVLARPASGNQTTASFNYLKVGNLTLTATAYPNADGSGVAQAQGTTPLALGSGQTVNVTVTMASTISRLTVSPPSASLGVGQTVTLTATALDSFGNVVLISPNTVTWVSDNPAVAKVDATGKVSMVAVGEANITATETESGKSASATITPNSLVSWWKAEGNALDVVGGNNGAIYGGVTYGPGVVGQAFVFDGSTGGIAIPDANNLKITGSLTIDAWVNVASIPARANNYGMVLFRGDDRLGLDPYALGMQFDGNLHFIVWSQTQSTDLFATIALGRWVHVTATLDDATGDMRIYEDGVVVAETMTAVRPFRDLDPAFKPGIAIGNSNDPVNYNYPFQGSIDELKVYNQVVPP